VTVYARGSTSLLRSLSPPTGVDLRAALVFDRFDNLYVAGGEDAGLAVYAPGSTSPFLTNFVGVNSAVALAFDRSQNVYVADYDEFEVTVYAPGSTSVLRTLFVDFPSALAVDRIGDLYVAEQFDSAVKVYGPGASEENVLRTISQGVSNPTALAFGS